MAINFVDGKYVDEKGIVKLDPTMYADWQIAEEAEKTLPSVEYFREKLGLLPEALWRFSWDRRPSKLYRQLRLPHQNP